MPFSLSEPDADLFLSGAQALVNPVNCQGHMGKGLALQFKNRYPYTNTCYKTHCRERKLRPGQVFVVREPSGLYIVCFATKDHWYPPSRMEWVEEGLVDLAAYVRHYRIGSIAVPALGCGEGKLPWRRVLPRIEDFARLCPDTLVIAYPPKE